jgi:integrase
LDARAKPYWRAIDKGLHIGYRKGKTGGSWVRRRSLGEQNYKVETLAKADDNQAADGVTILDFWQAQEFARGKRETRPKHGYTVAMAVKAYLEGLEGKASHHDATKRMEAFILPTFGDRAVESLEADEIRRWHKKIAKTPARKRTRAGAVQAYRQSDMADPEVIRQRQASANRCLSFLKAALNRAWKEGKVKSADEWERVDLFRGVDVPRTRYLSLPEAKRLINASQGDFRTLVRAALETGARYSELGRLWVQDFNPDVGTLHIRKTKVHKDRHIVLTDEGREFFTQLAAGRAGSDLLLGRKWGTNHQAPLILKACKQAKIDPPINFHALRHTWASLAVMAGVPLMVVAKNLGHSDTRMVQEHYGHLSPDFVANEIRTKAPRFGKVEPKVRALR